MMTFDEVKAEVLLRSRGVEMCDLYQKVFVSTTYEELIGTANDLIFWIISNNIVDEDMLSNFPTGDLQSYGFYWNDEFTVNDPVISDFLGFHRDTVDLETAEDEMQTLYCYTDCIMNLNLTAGNACKVVAMSNSQVIANIQNNSRLELICYHDSVCDITALDNSMLCVETNGNSSLNINSDNTSNTRGKLAGKSITNYVGAGSSYAFINAYKNSILNYLFNDTATGDLTKFHAAQIILSLP